MSEIVIRPATEAEAPEVGALTAQAYEETEVADESYSVELRDAASRIQQATVLVAALNGQIAGSVTLAAPGTRYAEISRTDELEVRMLATGDHARRQGVADLLMDAAEDHARSLGLGAVILSTAPSMQAAHRLYERRGYERAPDRDWAVDDIGLMAYRLALTA